MAHDIKTSADHPASMADRINKRSRNSGEGARPDVTVQQGNSAQRTFTNIHHGASQGGLKRGNDSDRGDR